MKNKLLSIIVPAYNIEKFLTKSIRSLGIFLSNVDVEILIVNDGSIDETYQVAMRLSDVFNNIKVVNKSNGGLSDARNVGNKLASGQYIYFFDGDDYLNTEFIPRILDIIRTYNVDILCFGYSKVDEHDHVYSQHIFDSNSELSTISNRDFVKSLVGDPNEPIAGYLPTKIIKHNLVKNIKFRDMNYEDMPFILELLETQKLKSIYLNKAVYNYVQRNNSITHSVSEKNLLDKLNSLKLVQESIEKQQLDKSIHALNVRRSMIAVLWVSSLNNRINKSGDVSTKSNIYIKKIIRSALKLHVVFPIFESAKILYYLLKNKMLGGRG